MRTAWGRGLLAVVAAMTFWTAGPATGHAQRMSLALSRLRTAPSSGIYGLDEQGWLHVANEFAGAMIPNVLIPAHTRGMRGIHVQVETAITGITESNPAWHRAVRGDGAPSAVPCGGEPPDPGSNCFDTRIVDQVLVWNRLNARKGLPLGFELGANVGFLTNTDYWALGADIRWALLEGLRGQHTSAYFPSLSVRAGVQTLLGDDELNVTIAAFDVNLGWRVVLGDRVELSPFIGPQLSWSWVDTELVDLTPDIDPLNPAPIEARVEFENNQVFPSVRAMRLRIFAGMQIRYEFLALTAAFAFEPADPSGIDSAIPQSVAQQWTANVGLGISY